VIAQSAPGDNLTDLDWHIWLGLTLTVGWIVLGIAYVSSTIGWTSFPVLPAEKFSNFLEGAFAPLAFLWLVIGYFLQQKELQQNTRRTTCTSHGDPAFGRASRYPVREASPERDARAPRGILANRKLGKRPTWSIAGLLFLSSQSGTRSEQEISSSQNRAVDSEAFSRRLLSISLRLQDARERFDLFYGTEVRARHTNNFIFTFERLMNRARSVDTEDMIQDALSASGHGFLYRVLKRQQAQAPEQWSDHTKTGTHINF
jgi:hypothetical protein